MSDDEAARAREVLDDGMRTSVKYAREVVAKHEPSRHGLLHNLDRLEAFLSAFAQRPALQDGEARERAFEAARELAYDLDGRKVSISDNDCRTIINRAFLAFAALHPVHPVTPVEAGSVGECDVCGGSGKNNSHQLWPGCPCRICHGSGRLPA